MEPETEAAEGGSGHSELLIVGAGVAVGVNALGEVVLEIAHCDCGTRRTAVPLDLDAAQQVYDRLGFELATARAVVAGISTGHEGNA